MIMVYLMFGNCRGKEKHFIYMILFVCLLKPKYICIYKQKSESEKEQRS